MENDLKPGYTWAIVTGVQPGTLKENKPVEVLAGAKKVCLMVRDGKLYAFSATCPHAGAPMCEGWVDAQGRIVCALHKYRFDPGNGRNTSGEGYKLMTYGVKTEGETIKVAVLVS